MLLTSEKMTTDLTLTPLWQFWVRYTYTNQVRALSDDQYYTQRKTLLSSAKEHSVLKVLKAK